MTQNIPVRKEFPYSKIGSWSRADGYTIAFVYPKGDTPFVVKGGMQDVKRYIESKGFIYERRQAAIIYYAIFCRGSTRTITDIIGLKNDTFALIKHINKSSKRKCYSLIVYVDNQVVVNKPLRRPPRCWMRELNQFI